MMSVHLRRKNVAVIAILLAGLLFAGALFAHGVAPGDADFLERNAGHALLAFMYLGAKHMITGYDHLLYLLGVIFYLYRPKDIAVYVTLFAVGHSITLLSSVLGEINVNAYLVDAVIGLSVAYKAFENLDGFKRIFNRQPNPKIAVFSFGLVHGFGLATKLQDLTLSQEGLVANIIAFNVGVEIGQLLALVVLAVLINAWRAAGSFDRHANAFNLLLMFAGFALAAYQISGQQQSRISLPRRFTAPMREMLAMQPRFNVQKGKRAYNLLEHRRFRAAYDFMMLRAEVGEIDIEIAHFWTGVQKQSADERRESFAINQKAGTGKRRPRRRRSKKSAQP